MYCEEYKHFLNNVYLHVKALYVGHLQVEIQLTEQLYKMYGVFIWGLGGGERDLVPPTQAPIP